MNNQKLAEVRSFFAKKGIKNYMAFCEVFWPKGKEFDEASLRQYMAGRGSSKSGHIEYCLDVVLDKIKNS